MIQVTNHMQMMEMLANLEAENAVYISYNSDILDFTDRTKIESYRLIIMAKNSIYELPIDTDWLIRLFVKASKNTLFAQGKKIVCWNWKNFLSFCKGKYGAEFSFECSIIDLKIIESFLGLKQSKPSSFGECFNRLRDILDSGKWSEIQNIYKKIYLPMILEVIPSMETTGILDQQKLHAYYEIAGQENGRLLCFNAYNRGYVPHIITPEQKSCFKPLNFDQIFVYFDFKSMEVKILNYLSKDSELDKICQTDDIYKSVYELIMKSPCDSAEKRNFCKSFFLPVFYGMSANTLALNLELPTAAAESIVGRIKNIFSEAYAWIENYQAKAKEDKFVCDIFGKKRYLPEKEYKARNFIVQSPAAIFCFEKLIMLHQKLKNIATIAYNVHDGYMLYSTRESLKKTIITSQETLMSESVLFPNLKLGISCYAGRQLVELKKINLPKQGNT